MVSDLWEAGRYAGDDVVDIVTPVYNQLQYTRDCLQSVREYTEIPYRVIVIDNGSTDETPAFLQECIAAGMPIEVITNARNLGFTLAANQGLRASGGRYVVSLNNDTTVTAGWLSGLIMTAESDDSIGIVGPKILNPATGRIHCIGGLVFGKRGMGPPPGQGCERDDPAFAQSFDCQYIEGSCMLIKRRVLEAIGHFDETYAPAYYEDADYCFRAREAGFRLIYSPLSEIYHHSTVTARAVRSENSELDQAARRNDCIFRERWTHRFA